MPGTLLPPSSIDPRWRRRLRLELVIFDREAKTPPPPKLSEILASASLELAEDAADLERTNGSSEEDSSDRGPGL